MKTAYKTLVSVVAIFSLTGCLYGQCFEGPCALGRAQMIAAIKPYGAHWVKEGMSEELRLNDIQQCGGGEGA